jgi:hypothetical protein
MVRLYRLDVERLVRDRTTTFREVPPGLLAG